MMQAEELAETLGESTPDADWLEAEKARLRKRMILPLEHVSQFHDWLDGKRMTRQSCRVVGESRTGKTVSCEAYVYRNKPHQEKGKRPIVPVVYIHPPEPCSSKDLFTEIIKSLKYRVTRGTVSDFRSRAFEVLRGCDVEMLIIDEADRLKPETFANVRDIYDKLCISVVLVGTDRLDTVIKRDEQVYNRFRACYQFGKLSGDDFVRTVKIWEQKVLKLPVASNLTNKTMQKILLEATEGLIGRLHEVLRDAAIKALERGMKRIEKSVLQEAAKEQK